MIKTIFTLCKRCSEEIKHKANIKVIKCYKCLTLIDLGSGKISSMDADIHTAKPTRPIERYDNGEFINPRRNMNKLSNWNLYQRLQLEDGVPSYTYFNNKVRTGVIEVPKTPGKWCIGEIRKKLLEIYLSSGSDKRNTRNMVIPTYKEIHAAAGIDFYDPRTMGTFIASGKIKPVYNLTDKTALQKFREDLLIIKKINQEKMRYSARNRK
jgi:hypothetical protein